MFARHVPSGARKNHACARLIINVPLFTVLLVTMFTSLGLSQGVNYTGRWTPPHTTNGIAIHLTLLPGDGTLYHSEVLWWTGENDELGPFQGGLWGWQPGTCQRL